MSETTTTGAGVAAYDAAKNSPNRSSFVAFPTNSRKELTPVTIREIRKKSRALEANCPVASRIISKFARQAVGNGIHFRFITDDLEWNAIGQRDVESWWNNKDTYSIDGTVDGWDAKRIAAETIVRDGEYPAVFTKENDWPMIQPLDVFEIENPILRAGESPRDWDDGVRINQFERPIEYAVRTLPRLTGDFSRDYRYIPKASFVHLSRRRRARGHRAPPWGYSGMNMGIDALDLQSLMCGTAKLHSALAVTVKKTARKGKRGAIGKITDGSGGADPTDTAALEKVYGSMINYLGENGEIDLKSSDHPGVNMMEFRKVLCHEQCIAYDLPFGVVWSYSESGGGTGVRADMEDAQSTFDLLTDTIIWGFVRREIIWKISLAVKTGRIRACKDPFWFEKIVFRGPRKMTVDVGRMANAFKILTRNAGMSIPRFLEEQSLDAYAEMDDQIRFLKYVKEKAEAEGVPVEWLYEPTPGTVNNFNAPPSSE